MYMAKVSYGYGDEPDMALTETLGTYETWGEACEVAEDKFGAIKEHFVDLEACFGEIEGSQYDYYVTYGDHNVEYGRVFSGYEYYCKVSIIEL